MGEGKHRNEGNLSTLPWQNLAVKEIRTSPNFTGT
jgi:hypothetical protein